MLTYVHVVFIVEADDEELALEKTRRRIIEDAELQIYDSWHE